MCFIDKYASEKDANRYAVKVSDLPLQAGRHNDAAMKNHCLFQTTKHLNL
jgi:hypothetical protein